MDKLSRREFMRFSGLAALGAVIAACAPKGGGTAGQGAQPAGATQAPKPVGKVIFWPEWGGKDADALKAQVDKFVAEAGAEVEFLPVRDHDQGAARAPRRRDPVPALREKARLLRSSREAAALFAKFLPPAPGTGCFARGSAR